MNRENYSLIYNVSFDAQKKGYTKEYIEKLEKGTFGACDALILISIIRNGLEVHQGSKSMVVTSIDGFESITNERAVEVPLTEYFQAMGFIAMSIKDEAGLPQWQKNICNRFLNDVRISMGGEPR